MTLASLVPLWIAAGVSSTCAGACCSGCGGAGQGDLADGAIVLTEKARGVGFCNVSGASGRGNEAMAAITMGWGLATGSRQVSGLIASIGVTVCSVGAIGAGGLFENVACIGGIGRTGKAAGALRFGTSVAVRASGGSASKSSKPSSRAARLMGAGGRASGWSTEPNALFKRADSVVGPVPFPAGPPRGASSRAGIVSLGSGRASKAVSPVGSSAMILRMDASISSILGSSAISRRFIGGPCSMALADRRCSLA